MAKCTAITRGGARCKGIAIDSSGYCHAHHPDRAEARSRAASKGGRSGGRGRKQVEVPAIKRQLQELAGGVLDGSIQRADASVVSQILNVLLRAISVELQVREQMELVPRMEELEEQLDQTKRRQQHEA
jgi:hypothetical protein